LIKKEGIGYFKLNISDKAGL